MSLKKFKSREVFTNTMRAHPSCDFAILEGRVIYNNVPDQSGSRNTDVRNVNTAKGYVSLYEFNIDRPYVVSDRIVGEDPSTSYTASVTASEAVSDPITFVQDTGRIYPWISKDSARSSFNTVGATSYNNEFMYGDVLTGEYPLSASITRELIATPSSSAGTYNARYVALRNSLNFYGLRSEHYKVSSSYGNKDAQTLNTIAVPSIFYGTQIKPGSVSLKMYVTGTLIGELQDKRRNGELIQVNSGSYAANGANSGSVAGVVLYDEGYIVLTGSWAMNGNTYPLSSSGTPYVQPSWIYFGAGANDGLTLATQGQPFGNFVCDLSFLGTTETQVLTMFAHAKRGEANYSTNPTYLQYGQDKSFFTSSNIYEENSELLIKNIASSSHATYSASFERQVYISRVGIYDANKNLLGIATLSSPVLKKADEDISFKLKLDV
jgi:hypothetical protein